MALEWCQGSPATSCSQIKPECGWIGAQIEKITESPNPNLRGKNHLRTPPYPCHSCRGHRLCSPPHHSVTAWLTGGGVGGVRCSSSESSQGVSCVREERVSELGEREGWSTWPGYDGRSASNVHQHHSISLPPPPTPTHTRTWPVGQASHNRDQF